MGEYEDDESESESPSGTNEYDDESKSEEVSKTPIPDSIASSPKHEIKISNKHTSPAVSLKHLNIGSMMALNGSAAILDDEEKASVDLQSQWTYEESPESYNDEVDNPLADNRGMSIRTAIEHGGTPKSDSNRKGHWTQNDSVGTMI